MIFINKSTVQIFIRNPHENKYYFTSSKSDYTSETFSTYEECSTAANEYAESLRGKYSSIQVLNSNFY